MFAKRTQFAPNDLVGLRDADDDMVLEVAVNGQADAIVTFNRRDFRPATERFGIEVLLPGAAIERLGGIS
jgi:predicted nucleic acid-binding protein